MSHAASNGHALTPAQRAGIYLKPAQAPPPGIKPTYIPQQLYPGSQALVHTLFAISTVVFLVRMYAQLRIYKKMSLEDYILALSWVVYAGAFEPVAELILRLPMGDHQWNMKMGHFFRHLFLFYTNLIIYGIIIMLLKISILLQCIRVFVPAGTRTFTFYASHILIWANVLYYITFTFLIMFSCNPRAKFWDKTIMEGKCIDFLSVNVSGAVICVISDLLILLLPQGVIWSLNMPRSRKIGLSALFTVGIFGVVTSAVRLYYHVELWRTKEDYTYQLGHICLWATAQIIAGYFIACLPYFPLVSNNLRKQPWATRFETSIRSMLNISQASTQEVSYDNSGFSNKKKRGMKMVTDPEFHELVESGDGTSSFSMARDEEREPKYNGRRK